MRRQRNIELDEFKMNKAELNNARQKFETKLLTQ